MSSLDLLREKLPEWARDIKVNLQTVLQSTSLSPAQRWGTALTAAVAARNLELQEAIYADASTEVGPECLEDAVAAAGLMGQNNIYYRFRHLVGKEVYSQKPARLRMSRIGKPAGPKLDFELFCLVASAINACEACVRSHEKVCTDAGMTDEAIHDAVRIGAAFHGAAVALESIRVSVPAPPA